MSPPQAHHHLVGGFYVCTLSGILNKPCQVVVIKRSRASAVFWFPFYTGRHMIVYSAEGTRYSIRSKLHPDFDVPWNPRGVFRDYYYLSFQSIVRRRRYRSYRSSCRSFTVHHRSSCVVNVHPSGINVHSLIGHSRHRSSFMVNV